MQRVRCPEFQTVSPLVANAPLQRLYSGVMWAKGRSISRTSALLFSDAEKDSALRRRPETHRVPQPSSNANGNTRERQGRLLTCEATAVSHARNTTKGHCSRRTLRGQAPTPLNDIVVAQTTPPGSQIPITDT